MEREKRRRFILEKAMEVIGKRGLRRTKMEHIAEACGIGKSTLYEYFSSKKALVEEIMNFYYNEYLSSISESLSSIDNPEKWLEKFIELNFMFIWAQSIELKVVFDIWAELARDEQGIEWLKEVYSSWRKKIEDAIKEGQKRGLFSPYILPFSIATFMIATMDCLFLQRCVGLLDGHEKEIESDYKKVFLNILRLRGAK